MRASLSTSPSRIEGGAVLDVSPEEAFAADVAEGLGGSPKSLPCKHFYDAYGSSLFDRICELEEYYPTRTELAITRDNASQMADALGPAVALVEYGSGSSVKTRLLLDALEEPAAYVPLDISGDHLDETAERLRNDYPGLPVLPCVADFSAPFDLPDLPDETERRAIYFPGSTLGNFDPDAAVEVLRGAAEAGGEGARMLVGIDLQKDPAIIEAAYNDREGVTAAFNKNLLTRINAELDGEFVLDRFTHRAVYNPTLGRVETDLVSNRQQTVRVGDAEYAFDEGEPIRTEHSHKYTLDGFAKLARRGCFRVEDQWTDDKQWFAVVLCVAE